MDAIALRCCCGVVEVGTFALLEVYDKGKFRNETIEEFEERFVKTVKDKLGATAFVMATLKVGNQTNTFGPLLTKMGCKRRETELKVNSGNRVNFYLVRRTAIKWEQSVLDKIAKKVTDMWPKQAAEVAAITSALSPAAPTVPSLHPGQSEQSYSWPRIQMYTQRGGIGGAAGTQGQTRR